MAKHFATAIAAMRDRASTAEVLALYDHGAMTLMEVLSVAWEACHDRPDLQVELIRQFRAHPDEYVVSMVGDGLADMAAQLAAWQADRGGDSGA